MAPRKRPVAQGAVQRAVVRNKMFVALTANHRGSRRLAADGNLGLVATDSGDVVTDHAEGEDHIAKGKVGVRRGRSQGGREETKETKTVLNKNDNNVVLGRNSRTAETRVGNAATDVRATRDPAC